MEKVSEVGSIGTAAQLTTQRRRRWIRSLSPLLCLHYPENPILHYPENSSEEFRRVCYIMAGPAEVLTVDNCAQSCDGWTIVLPRGKRRSKKLPKIGYLEEQGVSWTPSDIESSDEDRRSKLERRMVGCMKRVENSVFYQNFLEQMRTQQVMDHFDKVLEGSEQKKMQMVVYGIGSIESHETPRLQLSIALLIKREFSWIGELEVFDPVLSATECRVLEAFGCSVLSVNEQGRRRANSPTLFYMPHCEAGLYNNLLQANWDVEALNRVVLFGNSFQLYRQYASFKNLTVVVDSSHILAVENVTDEFVLSAVSEDYFAAFHDSSWHFFRPCLRTDLPNIDRN